MGDSLISEPTVGDAQAAADYETNSTDAQNAYDTGLASDYVTTLQNLGNWASSATTLEQSYGVSLAQDASTYATAAATAASVLAAQTNAANLTLAQDQATTDHTLAIAQADDQYDADLIASFTLFCEHAPARRDQCDASRSGPPDFQAAATASRFAARTPANVLRSQPSSAWATLARPAGVHCQP